MINSVACCRAWQALCWAMINSEWLYRPMQVHQHNVHISQPLIEAITAAANGGV